MHANNWGIPREIFCLHSVVAMVDETWHKTIHAMAAKANPDTLMYHKGMRANNLEEFVRAMMRKWEDQLAHENFSIMKRNKLPEGATLLPAVWEFCRKRNMCTRVIKKYKARLNVDGSKQIKGVHFDKTYAPVAQ